MLHHPWTYQALVNDLLGMQANRVTILNSEDSSVASRSKTYDLDILGDEFWQANVGQPFPEVTERIDQELQAYKSAVEKIKGTQLRSSDEDLSNLTSGLASAIDSLPELQRKKAMVDTHTSLASALMKVLTDRSLDLYFSLEERMIVAGTNPDKGTLVELLDTQAKGSAEDKLRLFIIYYLTRSRKMSDAEFNDFQELLKSSGCDLSALVFLRRLHVMSSMNSASTVSDPKIASSLFGNFADKAIGKGIDWLAGNVKNLLPVKSDLLTTSVVKELMANTASQGPSGSNSMVSSENVGRYLYLDPKVGEEKAKNPPRNRTPFKEAIVFVVGGGNYVEHQNLQDFANRSKAPSSRSIIYGSTEIVSPNQFLEQLSGLGYSQDNPEINLT